MFGKTGAFGDKSARAVLAAIALTGGAMEMAHAQPQPEPGTKWTNAFEQKTENAFAEALSENVVLEAAALVTPIVGRDKVKISMATASNLYTQLVFTSKDTAGSNTYLQWTAVIPGDVKLKGVTVLTKNEQGQISRIGIYHSPLEAMLKFSEAMGALTRESIGPGHFYKN